MIAVTPCTAVLLFASMLAVSPASAQTDAPAAAPSAQSDAPPPPDGPHHGGPGQRLAMLERELNLSADQTTQIKAVFAAERTQMDALRTNTALTEQDRHVQMQAIHQQTDAKIRALLTSDQVTKYDALEARRREHRPGGDGPPPPPTSDGSGER